MADIGYGKIQANVNAIAANIVDGISSVFGKGGNVPSKRYPSTVSGTNVSLITNQPDYRKGAWKDSLGYAFQVYRVKAGTSTLIDLSKNEGDWQEFRLQINPQELTQDEIFAIQVTPTFRGVIVEHHGQILKDITIAGTTGKSPKSREGGVVPATGKPVLASGHSGHEEFNELRSYIRTYVESKRVDGRGDDGELRLVFKNFKDGEFLFVEPQKFTMKRSAAKSVLYDYNIQLKAIGVAEAPGKVDSENFGLIGDIFKVVDQATSLLNASAQVFQASFALISRVEQDLVNTVLGPVTALSNTLESIRNGSSTVINRTRSQVEFISRELDRVNNNLADAVGVAMGVYNTLAGRTSTLSAETGKTPTSSEIRALHGFQLAKRGVSLVLSENSLFQQSIGVENRSAESIYDNKITLPVPNSSRAVVILGGDTIQTLAARELGDPDRFKDIVILNNLRAPYIDDLGGNGVLSVGDKILIPQSSQQESTGVKRNKQFEISRLLNETEKDLGVDIRLDNNNDLAVGNNGDLDLIAGVDNLSQAILIKLNLEPGGLKRHLTLGVGLPIGRKVTTSLLSEIRSNLIGSLSSDLRIDSVPFLELKQEGGTTIINAVLRIKDLNLPIPLPITVTGAA